MRIRITDNIGFCGGVKNAIEKAKEAAKKYGQVQMLGDIVHNEKVVAELDKIGVKVVRNLDNIDKDLPILFRAHGTTLQTWKEARDKDLDIIDATCPLVKEIHKIAQKLEDEGRRIIVIGDHGHDEVIGITSRLKEPLVIADIKELIKIRPIKKAGVIVQSTQYLENVSEIISGLSKIVTDLRFVNTICNPTQKRQEQIKMLAENNDVIIVVGSKTSANTKRLTQIARSINSKCYQVNGAEDIKEKWFKSASSVGISAGASTPDIVVSEVAKKLSLLLN